MSKKNKKIQLPKRTPLLYLLLILIPVVVFLAIAIPVEYVSTYNKQRVYVFQSEAYDQITSEADEDGNTKTTYEKKDDITWGNIKDINDFDLYLYCNEYNDGGTVSFGVFGVKNENTANLNITQFTIKLGFFNSWINVNTTSSQRTVKLVDNAINAVKAGTSTGTSYNPSISVSLNTDLPKKGPLPFTKINNLPVYAFISYTVKVNGENLTKDFVIKMNYNDYMIEKTIIDEGTANETFIKPSGNGIIK